MTDVNFWILGAGHRVRISTLINYLKKYTELCVIYIGLIEEAVIKLIEKHFEIRFIALNGRIALKSDGYGMLLKQILSVEPFDAIIIEYIHNSYFLKYINPDILTFLDIHDIVSKRNEALSMLKPDHGLFTLPSDIEIELFKYFDYVLAICKPDYDYLISIIGREKTILSPHAPQIIKSPLAAEVKNVSFIGSEYLPNVDAITFFIQNCWPQINEENDLILNVYGKVCGSLQLEEDDSIILKGYVHSLGEIYKNCDIVINPVRFGSGIKIKNLEALAYGKPLITTTHGARGLEAGINKAFLVADNANEMIQALTKLRRDKHTREKLILNAFELLEKKFSTHKCYQNLLNKINSK